MRRVRRFYDGNRILVIGAVDEMPKSVDAVQIVDATVLRARLVRFVDTSAEFSDLAELAQSSGFRSSARASKHANIDRIVRQVSSGSLVAIELTELANEPEPNLKSLTPIEDQSTSQKLDQVVAYLPDYLGQEVWDEIKALIDPVTIAVTLGLIVLAFFSGVGAVILIAVGLAFVGWSIFDAVDKFADFVKKFQAASSEKDLRDCARILADVIATIGVGAFVALLTRGAGRFAKVRAKGGAGKPGSSSRGSSGGSKTSRGGHGSGGGSKAPSKQPQRTKDDPSLMTKGERLAARRRHHNRMVEDVRAEREAAGATVFDTSGQLHVPPRETGRIAVPDLISKGADGRIELIEVKTGEAGRSVGQTLVYDNIGDAVPSPRLAQELGIKSGQTLSQGLGYTPQVTELRFPGVGL